MKTLIELAESAWLPDWLVRRGIRTLLARRLKQQPKPDSQQLETFIQQLKHSPLAVSTEVANEQHYEVPATFYQLVLGPHLKYSCGWWPEDCRQLADSEAAMLKLTCQRAELQNGMKILELGCGWGSLTLSMAKHYPNSQITAVSNSRSQREWIMSQARQQGLNNVNIITCDICDFETEQTFDRVVSVEMFEHLRNYQLLFKRISNWLNPQGKLFVHIFCHHHSPYLFETEGAANWMGRHFFTGGMMPSESLLLQFQDDLKIDQQWKINGQHYARTCESWLQNLDQNYHTIFDLFASDLDKRKSKIMIQRWRIFFMACAELFRYHGGDEWYVAHYLFENSRNSLREKTESPLTPFNPIP